MPKKKNILVINIILFLLLGSTSIIADTFILKDGSLVSGKIIKVRKRSYLVKNSYGRFVIKKRDVKSLIRTGDYRADFKLRQKKDKRVDKNTDKEDIEEDIVEEEDKIEEEDEETVGHNLDDSRLVFSGIYLRTLGELKDIIPCGYGGVATFDLCLDFIAGRNYILMPGLRFEGGYLYYENEPSIVRGATWSGGFYWLIPVVHRDFGCIVISGTAGMSHFEIGNKPYLVKTNTLTAWGTFGYEFYISNILFQLNGKYMYIFDKDIKIQGYGGGFGIGIRI